MEINPTIIRSKKSEFVFRTSEEELQHLKEAKAYVAESVELLIPAEMSQSTTQGCLPLQSVFDRSR